MNNSFENTSERNWHKLHFKVWEKRIIQAFAIFRSEGIEPILIKGWAIAKDYPVDKPRNFSDIDLCVNPEIYKRAKEISERDEIKKLNVDLHCGLRHLDTVEWNDLFENSKLCKIDTKLVRILRPEDHFRVLCVHWYQNRGAVKERLWDLYYCISSVGFEFDWNRCLDVVDENRKEWFYCAVGLVQKYLGIKIENFPFDEEMTKIPKWLIKNLEREWKTNIPLKPLQTCLNDRKEFIKQVKKRIPPNALQAIIECDGTFDGKRRFYYQLKNMILRIFPSIKRIGIALKR